MCSTENVLSRIDSCFGFVCFFLLTFAFDVPSVKQATPCRCLRHPHRYPSPHCPKPAFPKLDPLSGKVPLVVSRDTSPSECAQNWCQRDNGLRTSRRWRRVLSMGKDSLPVWPPTTRVWGSRKGLPIVVQCLAQSRCSVNACQTMSLSSAHQLSRRDVFDLEFHDLDRNLCPSHQLARPFSVLSFWGGKKNYKLL